MAKRMKGGKRGRGGWVNHLTIDCCAILHSNIWWLNTTPIVSYATLQMERDVSGFTHFCLFPALAWNIHSGTRSPNPAFSIMTFMLSFSNGGCIYTTDWANAMNQESVLLREFTRLHSHITTASCMLPGETQGENPESSLWRPDSPACE